MKLVNIRKAKAELSALVGSSQRSPICLTVHGRPVAVLTGTRGMDIEDILLAWDPEFWRDIDERTVRGRSESVTLEELRKNLESTRRVRRGRRTSAKSAK
jgi:prevent-host-death family protein